MIWIVVGAIAVGSVAIAGDLLICQKLSGIEDFDEREGE